jgi:hypothetical protein
MGQYLGQINFSCPFSRTSGLVSSELLFERSHCLHLVSWVGNNDFLCSKVGNSMEMRDSMKDELCLEADYYLEVINVSEYDLHRPYFGLSDCVYMVSCSVTLCLISMSQDWTKNIYMRIEIIGIFY